MTEGIRKRGPIAVLFARHEKVGIGDQRANPRRNKPRQRSEKSEPQNKGDDASHLISPRRDNPERPDHDDNAFNQGEGAISLSPFSDGRNLPPPNELRAPDTKQCDNNARYCPSDESPPRHGLQEPCNQYRNQLGNRQTDSNPNASGYAASGPANEKQSISLRQLGYGGESAVHAAAFAARHAIQSSSVLDAFGRSLSSKMYASSLATRSAVGGGVCGPCHDATASLTHAGLFSFPQYPNA